MTYCSLIFSKTLSFIRNPTYFSKASQFCLSNPETPKDSYQRFVAGETVAFMLAILDPITNCEYFTFLETSGNVGIYTENEYIAYDGWTKCTPTKCTLE